MHIFRALPELMIMLKALIAALRSMMVTFTLLFLVIYLFGLIFTQAMMGTPAGERYFATVPDSMLSLTFYGVFLDNCSDVFFLVGWVPEGSLAGICWVHFEVWLAPGAREGLHKFGGASHPTFLKAFPGPRGRQNLKNAPQQIRPGRPQVFRWATPVGCVGDCS